MRFRTVAASAALVLCAVTGVAACSALPGGSESSRPAVPGPSASPSPVDGMTGDIETGKRQAGPPLMEGQSGESATQCAGVVEEIPAECGLDLSFAESSDGQAAPHAPDAQ
ncbi:hypothetical protein DTW94_15900 [Streptomyces cavourensis]|uniref:Small secreted domain DUF320 n=1 Tax=Streptomyces cavourensis TaxID=67258 RepID=A0AAD0VFC3_9ACTN|nr:hypothetical protein DTW94_15900 [Streptomyces cavourensis]